jgi:multidrug efflux system membrane fusion protein
VLWPGQYVNARLQLGMRKQALTVPAGAVQRGQNGTYVYALDEQGIARIQPIHVAMIQDNIAVVDDGLKAGERVVLDGQYKLRPGLHTVESKAQAGATAMPGQPAGDSQGAAGNTDAKGAGSPKDPAAGNTASKGAADAKAATPAKGDGR